MRLSSMLWMVVIVCAASALYNVKYRVQEMDGEIAALRTQIKEEKSAMHVLSAEWAYLTRPERVTKLAKKHLNLEPVKGQQLAEVSDVPFPEGGVVRVVDQSHPKPSFKPGIVPVGGVGYVR